jgi:nucleotide-binding universal stress UspA family protein
VTAPRDPVLVCYDGSESARHAVERAAGLLGRVPAVVVCVWESVGSFVLRHHPRGSFAIAEDVVEELDSSSATAAEETVREGAELGRSLGLEAEPLARRAVARAGERDEATVWRTILEVADERDAPAIVLGSRGLSEVQSMLLGSVSYGVVHHSTRPVIVVRSPAPSSPASKDG